MNEQNAGSGTPRLRDLLHLSPDGKRIFVWRGPEDTNRLMATIAEAYVAELFEMNGGLMLLAEGQPVPVTRNKLREIIAKRIASVRLVNKGADWKAEFYSFDFPPNADTTKQPDDRVLTEIAAGLLLLVAKGPTAPVQLSEQQQFEVRQRVAMGEPRETIAAAYRCSVDLVRQLAR